MPSGARVVGGCVLLGVMVVATAASQDDPNAPVTGQETPVDVGAAVTPAPEGGRWGDFDPEAATAVYLDRLTAEQRERSDAYFEGGYWLNLWGFLWGLGVAALLLFGRLSARWRDLTERWLRRRPLRVALYGAGYVVAVALLSFPLTVYRDFLREHQYGLATQTIGTWLRDQAVGLGVGVVLTAILLVPLYAVLRRAPRTWWLWGAVVALVFLTFTVVIAPVYIDPLFNTYVPLDDAKVRDPILALARANGVPADEVYRFDASRQTTRISANVSGLFGTMRVRLNDNLLKRCSLPEIEAVMAHEIGHYALGHIYEMLISLGVVLVVGFAFMRFGAARALARWGGRWGVRDIADPAGVPLLAALLSVYFFAMTPLLNTMIRSNEAEADLFGLNAAQRPEGFAEVSLKLAEYRKLAPGPVEEWIFYDHPSGRSRILMAMRWKAQHLPGSPLEGPPAP